MNRAARQNWRFAPEGDVWLEPEWLTPAEADQLLAELTRSMAWEQREIVLFGKPRMQPRLIAWAGDVPYRYSGQTLVPRAAPPVLATLGQRVAAATGSRFNHVLLNRYRNGQDSMGWHSDDEPELGTNPTLASLSLGTARRFLLRPKRPVALTAAPRQPDLPSRPTTALELRHGSLLLMGGDLQHHYQHSVPKQARVSEERLNLTYRWITPKSA